MEISLECEHTWLLFGKTTEEKDVWEADQHVEKEEEIDDILVIKTVVGYRTHYSTQDNSVGLLTYINIYPTKTSR